MPARLTERGRLPSAGLRAPPSWWERLVVELVIASVVLFALGVLVGIRVAEDPAPVASLVPPVDGHQARMAAWSLVLRDVCDMDLYEERQRVLFRKFHAARVKTITGDDQLRLDLLSERVDAIDLELARRGLSLLPAVDDN